jgi:hypothetical protein
MAAFRSLLEAISHELVQSMPQQDATFGQIYPALKQHCAQLIGQPGPRLRSGWRAPVQHL